MRMRLRVIALVSALPALFLTSPLHANTVQDQLGQGSRAKALGGAGTAIARDPAATYYNPSGLSDCQHNQVSVELGHLVYGIEIDSDDARAGKADLSDRSSVAIGACVHLPYRLTIGFVFDTGLQGAQRLEQSSVSQKPVFALYGQPLEQISMMAGLSYRVSDRLSLGAGGAVLVNSDLGLSVQVPIIAGDEELASDIEWKLQPTAALYLGARYRPTPEFTLASSLRTALYHKLEGTAFTTVDVAGVLLNVDLLLEAVSWYSPLQASAGAAYELGEHARATFDLTWYNWSDYPGPYIQISPLDPEDTIAAGLNYPPREPLGFVDTLATRMGAELELSPKITARGGLAYRPTPAPIPVPGQRSTVLDGNVASATLGAGYEWGKTPSPGRASSGAPEAASSGVIDLHARIHHMAERQVSKEIPDEPQLDFRFGGFIFDAGVTLRVGW